MILADTSAWIDLFAERPGAVGRHLATLIEDRAPVVLTGLVLTEILQGIRDDRTFEDLRRRLAEFPCLPLRSPDDYVEAARIFRRCRRAGLTVRGTIDCLLAALALRVRAEVLHRDRDFDAIGRACPRLRVAPVPAGPAGAGGGT